MPWRPTRVVVDLSALRHNVSRVSALAAATPLCAVIKADAYGHGAVPVARELEQAPEVAWLAVSSLEEGIELREAGVQARILVLFGAHPHGYADALRYTLTPTLWELSHMRSYARAVVRAGAPRAPFHLMVDTGMARTGVTPKHAPALLDAVAAEPRLEMVGLMTHLANADMGDMQRNDEQIAAFAPVEMYAAELGLKPKWTHISNSGGILTLPRAHKNLVRPGALLYGYDPSDHPREDLDLKPVMRWETRAIHCHRISKGTRVSYDGIWSAPADSMVATLPVGYADGYPRCLTEHAEVLVRGVRVPVVGRVCMDLIVIDVTRVPEFELDDNVILMGDDDLTASDLARWAHTTAREITCGVQKRVPRIYENAR